VLLLKGELQWLNTETDCPEVAELPSLEILKTHLDTVLGSHL